METTKREIKSIKSLPEFAAVRSQRRTSVFRAASRTVLGIEGN